MTPIEVGVWNASLQPWREKYGKEIRGVGGMDKRVLTTDKAAIREMVESKRALIEEGGYVPGVDHAIPPDVPWENYLYYRELLIEIGA